MQIKKIFLIIFVLEVRSSFGKIECLDQDKESVDWYVVFKAPKIKNSDPIISSGEAFMYITSKTLAQGWTWSQKKIQHKSSLLANTLKPYYEKQGEGLWIAYNDQNPSTTAWKIKGGHTKGVVGADDAGGIWLVHSIPKYPLMNKYGYGYPRTGYTHGQSALCMSLSQESLNQVGKLLSFNNPDIYESWFDDKVKGMYPDLVAATNKSTVGSPFFNITDLKTVGGATFRAFAKSKRFNNDLYELIANDIQNDLLVESWQNAFITLPSACSSKYRVMNIQKIEIENKSLTYSSRKDHSKWAIGSTAPWTCIGDINRMRHQEKRGGGAVCMNDESLWKQYDQVVATVERCTK